MILFANVLPSLCTSRADGRMTIHCYQTTISRFIMNNDGYINSPFVLAVASAAGDPRDEIMAKYLHDIYISTTLCYVQYCAERSNYDGVLRVPPTTWWRVRWPGIRVSVRRLRRVPRCSGWIGRIQAYMVSLRAHVADYHIFWRRDIQFNFETGFIHYCHSFVR